MKLNLTSGFAYGLLAFGLFSMLYLAVLKIHVSLIPGTNIKDYFLLNHKQFSLLGLGFIFGGFGIGLFGGKQ